MYKHFWDLNEVELDGRVLLGPRIWYANYNFEQYGWNFDNDSEKNAFFAFSLAIDNIGEDLPQDWKRLSYLTKKLGLRDNVDIV